MIHIWRPLWKGRGVRQKYEVLLDVGEWEVSECSGRPIFIFLWKKTGFAPWLDIILRQKSILIRNLPFDSDIKKWSHPLILNVTRLSFGFVLISFVPICTVRLLFRSLVTFSSYANNTCWLQNEYVLVKNYKLKTFLDVFGQLPIHTRV